MTDLFSWRGYPETPGYQARDTSRAAADAIEDEVGTIRAAVLAQFRSSTGLTADEVAKALGLSVLTVRPRVTELGLMGKLKDSGGRRKNASGRNAIVWVA